MHRGGYEGLGNTLEKVMKGPSPFWEGSGGAGQHRGPDPALTGLEPAPRRAPPCCRAR